MTSESNSKIQGTQSGKPTSYKRAHRANRPVVVTAQADEPTMQAIEEAVQPVTQVAVEEMPVVQEPRRRVPKFFSSIGKTEQSEADPKAARLARAMRGKSSSAAQEEAPRAKKAAASPAKEGVTPARPRSKWKMRYLYGMMIYVLVAEYLGGFVTNFMVTHGLEGKLFQLGPIPFSRSTLVFLAILVVVLVLMARFDLIPKSFMSMRNDPKPSGTSVKAKGEAATFETKAPQPTMRQGVQGAHDELYQEYRSNQRYFQKRDRKR